MVLLILLLPLISFIILSFFSSYLGRSGVLLYSIFNMSIINLLSLFLFFICFLNNNVIYVILNNWFSFISIDVSWIFKVDVLSISMTFIVTLISLFVHVYSVDYMFADPNRSIFLGYLSLFTFFMILLVCSGNLFIFFFSWEGVGICSYLLINFWNTRILATQSAIKALLVNRISDLFLLSGLVKISLLSTSVDLTIVELCIDYISYDKELLIGCLKYNIIEICCFFLFIGIVGKSAQLFLHTWLPDAMEGPTPVSALLHAATMVTAGIFLLLRFSFIFDSNMYILEISGIIGALTIIVSGTIGLYQFDIKKVIAYSTCSQLGYMLIACSASVYYISLFHFTIHAFFKALLFLLSGCVIHSFSNEQDMRKYGGLLSVFPLCCIMFIVGSSALVAEPFLSGYYSKELIIFSLNDVYLSVFNFVYWISIYGAILTVLYSTRSLWLVFFSYYRGFFTNIFIISELNYILFYPLFILSLMSIFGGYLYSGLYNNGSLFVAFYNSAEHIVIQHYIYDFLLSEHNYLIIIGNMLIVIIILFSHILNNYIYSYKYSICKTFFVNKWYFDNIYNRFFVLNCLLYSEDIFYSYLDKGFIELFGPFGLYSSVNYYSSNISAIKNYSLYTDIIYVLIYCFICIIALLCSYQLVVINTSL